MEKNNNQANIEISLSKIKEVSYSFNTDFDYASISVKNMSFGIKYETKINREEEIVRIISAAIYQSYESKETLAEYSIMIEFKVKGLSELISKDVSGEEKINRDFMLNLLNISIGTLRGAFFLKTIGTAFEKFPIPLIPTSILEDEEKEAKNE